MADPVTWIAIASATAAAASGTVGYLGAQRQAEGLEQQAEQASLLAANKSLIERNRAIAQMQDAQFQAGVADFNKQESIVQTDRNLQVSQDNLRLRLASMEAEGVSRGTFDYSFDDILRSEAFLAEREEADILYAGGQSGFEFSRQGDLAKFSGDRAIEIGRYSSGIALSEGRYTSSNLRTSASASRIGGIGTFVSGLSQAGSIASGINFKKD